MNMMEFINRRSEIYYKEQAFVFSALLNHANLQNNIEAYGAKQHIRRFKMILSVKQMPIGLKIR